MPLRREHAGLVEDLRHFRWARVFFGGAADGLLCRCVLGLTLLRDRRWLRRYRCLLQPGAAYILESFLGKDAAQLGHVPILSQQRLAQVTEFRTLFGDHFLQLLEARGVARFGSRCALCLRQACDGQ